MALGDYKRHLIRFILMNCLLLTIRDCNHNYRNFIYIHDLITKIFQTLMSWLQVINGQPTSRI